MQQEELARLFSANLNLSQVPSSHTPPPPPPQPEQQAIVEQPVQQQEQEQSTVNQPIVYASSHYTHSHHVVSSRPSEKTHIDPSELEGVFLRNSIDPSFLFPSQIDLFQNADDDQRLRLLELWRISPPQGRQGYPKGVDYNTSRQLYDWPPTSLAQEEAMAKLRYESMMEDQAQAKAQAEAIQEHKEHLDQSMDQGTESAAVHATRDLLDSPDARNAEPYIVSGYDMLARREYDESARASSMLRESTKYNQATDPVYNSGGGHDGLWEKNVGSILDMENQYGAFAHAREYDNNTFYGDQEMVM